MLLRFTFANFLSFRSETTLNMTPAKSRLKKDHIIERRANRKTYALPTALVYGANAGGKSNLLKALNFFQRLVSNPTEPGDRIPVQPFLLDNHSSKQDSSFEIVFRHNDIVYTYGIVISPERVKEEWLFAYFTRQESLVFERATDPNGNTAVEYGSALIREKGKAFLDMYSSAVRPEQLFLNQAFSQNVRLVEPVKEWFASCLVFAGSGTTDSGLIPLRIDKDEAYRNLLECLLKEADTGITGVTAVEEGFDRSRHFTWVPGKVLDDIEKMLRADKNGTAAITDPRGGMLLFLKNGSLFVRKLLFRHSGEGDSTYAMNSSSESDGTKQLIRLAPLLEAARKRDVTVVIDELDSSLHPLLSEFFLDLFLAGTRTGASGSQIIAATHDTNLLSSDLFRRDELWLVEKSSTGESSLSSLAEYRISKGLNLEKGYLHGRFSAVPLIGNADCVLREN